MNKRHLWTIRWTQPYATHRQRPYLRGLQSQLEQMVEQLLIDDPTYLDAKIVIKRIMEL
jgi:hypothetical protein